MIPASYFFKTAYSRAWEEFEGSQDVATDAAPRKRQAFSVLARTMLSAFRGRQAEADRHTASRAMPAQRG
jgi:hypothetical protein